MKRIAILLITVAVVIALVFGVSTAMAAKPTQTGGGKPPEVIAISNGFPSGFHFNLNIHGKNWETCQVDELGIKGNSIFIPEYGNATIELVSNKRKAAGNLTVIDACAGFLPDLEDDIARIQLPYKIEVDGQPVEAGGYYVYARLLGKPQHGKTDTVSSIVMIPDPIVQACNITSPDPDYGKDFTQCHDNEFILGLITAGGVYVVDEGVFKRFDPPINDKGQGKGKAKTTDITGLFEWTGWVGNETEFDTIDCDLNTADYPEKCDGNITEADIPAEAKALDEILWPGIGAYDTDPPGGDGEINLNEWLAYVAGELGLGVFFVNEWVFNVADIVIQKHKLVNDGGKLLQIRFYPRETTTFH